ncbi:MAG: HEAT repeat domain-containing protein, partial [Planctomycetes bacterium]|nr:HEAT repeat domain-containing protein [Planctomycetota bacterium]
MPATPWSISLNQTDSTSFILTTMLGLISLIGLTLYLGWLGALLGWAGRLIETSIYRGFRVWERILSWTRWPGYLVLVGGLLAFGIYSIGAGREWLGLLIAIILLTAGVAACLAFMQISIERYEVARGYKTVQNPVKGQELAHHVVRYGDRLGPVMLGISAVAVILGFTLLNQALYETLGGSWYIIREPDSKPRYLDFLAFVLINLLRLVDVLDLVRTSHFLNVSFVR